MKQIWDKYELGFYTSLIGSLAMGTIHLISICMNFSWIVYNYMIFCYLMAVARVLVWLLAKKNKMKTIYLLSFIIMLIILIPLGISLVMTIKERDTPHYLFDWIAYAYALYAFIKMGFAIKNLIKTNEEKKVLAYFGLINALFTMFMLQFALIKMFSEDNYYSMYILMMVSQAVIISIALYVTVLFIVKFNKHRKQIKQ